MGDFIRQYHSVDVSVAVQTPNGLMVPVVRNTDELGLQDINAAVKQLANKVGLWNVWSQQPTASTMRECRHQSLASAAFSHCCTSARGAQC